MRFKLIPIKAAMLLTVCLAACSLNKSGSSPSDFEIYQFFDKQLAQTARSGGYVNYKVKIDRYQQAQPSEGTTPDGNTVTTYPVKIDRTEYLTGYHETYVNTYKGDEYRLYRDDKGTLVVLSHIAGQTQTTQRPPSNF